MGLFEGPRRMARNNTLIVLPRPCVVADTCVQVEIVVNWKERQVLTEEQDRISSSMVHDHLQRGVRSRG